MPTEKLSPWAKKLEPECYVGYVCHKVILSWGCLSKVMSRGGIGSKVESPEG